jgi:hypothetical protein
VGMRGTTTAPHARRLRWPPLSPICHHVARSPARHCLGRLGALEAGGGREERGEREMRRGYLGADSAMKTVVKAPRWTKPAPCRINSASILP